MKTKKEITKKRVVLMNVSIIKSDNGGTFEKIYCCPEEAVQVWGFHLRNPESECLSAIGHESTAALFRELLSDESIKTNRINFKFNVGDLAIVCELRERQGEGKVIDNIDELKKIGFDMWYIRRVE